MPYERRRRCERQDDTPSYLTFAWFPCIEPPASEIKFGSVSVSLLVRSLESLALAASTRVENQRCHHRRATVAPLRREDFPESLILNHPLIQHTIRSDKFQFSYFTVSLQSCAYRFPVHCDALTFYPLDLKDLN